MIAFGTFKKKSAFKLYAKAAGMNFDLANSISEQIEKYEKDLAHAEEDEKDDIDIYDYVDQQYWDYLNKSKKYWGIISDKKKAPSAYLLYDGNIRREIGLIKCKSESTKKECITCCIDGAIAENYKFLKNDILKVDVSLLSDKVFKRIGIEHFDTNTLLEKIKDDEKVWNLYKNGYTIGINQIEKDGTRNKSKKYKPRNISELTAFIAAIRPGFKSMYKRFEDREDFSWGIKSLDDLIRTKELPVSFLFFQEQVMAVLHYGGFPMDQCYGIIKAIAKKHPEKVKPLKEEFLAGFKKQILIDEDISEEEAEDYASRVWTIINDNCRYSFNCVSGETRIITYPGVDLTIKEMYEIKNNMNREREYLNWYFNNIGYGLAFSMFKNKLIRMNTIVDIREAGTRQTYKVVVENGSHIICTNNHKFPTPYGERRLDRLKLGDKLYCMCENGIETYLSKIVSIEPYKNEMTYDISMADPAHNFVTESGLIASNSSHAYCMAIDSLYQAWQKANYPYEFYEVNLQHFSDKGNKDKVAKFKEEMKKAFGISEGEYKFRNDNRKFSADKEYHCINPALSSIKGLSNTDAKNLYKLRDKKYESFIEVLIDMKNIKIAAGKLSQKLDTLIKIGYFSEFGEINQLRLQAELFYKLYERKQIKKTEIAKYGIEEYCIKKYSGKETEKQYNNIDSIGLIKEMIQNMEYPKTRLKDELAYQLEFFGYISKVLPDMDENYYFVQNIIENWAVLYRLKDGETLKIKYRRTRGSFFYKLPFSVGDIIEVTEVRDEKKKKPKKDENGKYVLNAKGSKIFEEIDETEPILSEWKIFK